jgi:hypothetical protein
MFEGFDGVAESDWILAVGYLLNATCLQHCLVSQVMPQPTVHISNDPNFHN